LASQTFKTGLEVFASNSKLSKDWGRCGLLANQASVDASLVNAWKICSDQLGPRLVALFGPQHGYSGTVQYNMVETSHDKHGPSGLPVYSLYGETREPTEEMFSTLDTLIIDLQITGCRIYTWKATIDLCLKAAKKFSKKIIILDRPNPVGGEIVEGRVLDDSAKSFVGAGALPMRHALSTAEATRFLNEFHDADLEIVEMKNWDPKKYWHQLGRDWVLTSPMLPVSDSVYVYPGLVMIEGTHLSEGRGTTLPFQLVGAKYVTDAEELIDRIHEISAGAPGVKLRAASFIPTWNKWQKETCEGFQIIVENAADIRSYNLTLAIIRAFIELYPKDFEFEKPGYEYDYKNLPINLLIGSLKGDQLLKADKFSIQDSFWVDGINDYIEKIGKYLIYPRTLKH
jgi:uncharacterized protein YbbC (DUF1343 family)